MENYIFFLTNLNFLNSTLRLTDLSKELINAELLTLDEYTKILGFSKDAVLISTGSKSNDKRAEILKSFEALLDKAITAAEEE